MRRFGGLPIPFHKGTLLLSSPRLAVLNASFASLAFVKYRGAQIALWLKGRQCSLVLDIGEDVDMQCTYVLGYTKR